MRINRKSGNLYQSKQARLTERKNLLKGASLAVLLTAAVWGVHSYMQDRRDPDNFDVQAKEKVEEVKLALNSGGVLYRGGTVKGLTDPTTDLCTNVTFDLINERTGWDKVGAKGNRVGCEVEVTTVAGGHEKQWVWGDRHAPAYTDTFETGRGRPTKVQFLTEETRADLDQVRGIQRMGSGSPKTDSRLARIVKGLNR